MSQIIVSRQAESLQELRHYLRHIKRFWTDVIGKKRKYRPLVDYRTVRRLQMRNPLASALDREFIADSMEEETLFPLITCREDRLLILQNLQETDYIIPSLYTFFEDTKWLEPCAKILRKLSTVEGNKKKLSIKQSLLSNYARRKQTKGIFYVLEQTGFREVHNPKISGAEMGYRQLWLFAWRFFPELSSMLPRRDHGKAKPSAKAMSETHWVMLAQAADHLGFRSDNISKIISDDPLRRMTRIFLDQVRPPENFFLAPEARDQMVTAITAQIKTIPSNLHHTDLGSSHEPEIEISNRCGRPFQQSYERSKNRFFLNQIYDAREQKVSHFQVNRDIFIAFFGKEVVEAAQEEEEEGIGVQKTGVPAYEARTTGVSTDSANDKTQSQEFGGQHQIPNPTVNSERRLVLHQQLDEDGDLKLLDAGPDLESSFLFRNWEQYCEEGDIFIVRYPDAKWRHLKPSASGTIAPLIVELSKSHKFGVANIKRKKVEFIGANELFENSRDRHRDGVIYCVLSHSHTDGGGDDAIEEWLLGRTTKERLREVQERAARKRRREENGAEMRPIAGLTSVTKKVRKTFENL